MITAIIQARMGSTRLSGKMLIRIGGKTVLEHVLRRVRRATSIDRVIVATTLKAEDKKLGRLSKQAGAEVFYGSETDVLDRYYQAAKKFGAETIIRVTGDCPVIDSALVDRVTRAFTKKGMDYVSNVHPPTFPDGMDIEAFSFAALKRSWKEAQLPSEREHVTPYIYKNPGSFNIANIKNDIDLSSLRLTLDRPEDVLMIKKILAYFVKQGKPGFGLKEITRLWMHNPDFFRLNQNIQRDEGYQRSLAEDCKHI